MKKQKQRYKKRQRQIVTTTDGNVSPDSTSSEGSSSSSDDNDSKQENYQPFPDKATKGISKQLVSKYHKLARQHKPITNKIIKSKTQSTGTGKQPGSRHGIVKASHIPSTHITDPYTRSAQLSLPEKVALKAVISNSKITARKDQQRQLEQAKENSLQTFRKHFPKQSPQFTRRKKSKRKKYQKGRKLEPIIEPDRQAQIEDVVEMTPPEFAPIEDEFKLTEEQDRNFVDKFDDEDDDDDDDNDDDTKDEEEKLDKVSNSAQQLLSAYGLQASKSTGNQIMMYGRRISTYQRQLIQQQQIFKNKQLDDIIDTHVTTLLSPSPSTNYYLSEYGQQIGELLKVGKEKPHVFTKEIQKDLYKLLLIFATTENGPIINKLQLNTKSLEYYVQANRLLDWKLHLPLKKKKDIKNKDYDYLIQLFASEKMKITIDFNAIKWLWHINQIYTNNRIPMRMIAELILNYSLSKHARQLFNPIKLTLKNKLDLFEFHILCPLIFILYYKPKHVNVKEYMDNLNRQYKQWSKKIKIFISCAKVVDTWLDAKTLYNIQLHQLLLYLPRKYYTLIEQFTARDHLYIFQYGLERNALLNSAPAQDPGRGVPTCNLLVEWKSYLKDIKNNALQLIQSIHGNIPTSHINTYLNEYAQIRTEDVIEFAQTRDKIVDEDHVESKEYLQDTQSNLKKPLLLPQKEHKLRTASRNTPTVRNDQLMKLLNYQSLPVSQYRPKPPTTRPLPTEYQSQSQQRQHYNYPSLNNNNNNNNYNNTNRNWRTTRGNSRNRWCFRCGTRGHIQKNCRKDPVPLKYWSYQALEQLAIHRRNQSGRSYMIGENMQPEIDQILYNKYKDDDNYTADIFEHPKEDIYFPDWAFDSDDNENSQLYQFQHGIHPKEQFAKDYAHPIGGNFLTADQYKKLKKPTKNSQLKPKSKSQQRKSKKKKANTRQRPLPLEIQQKLGIPIPKASKSPEGLDEILENNERNWTKAFDQQAKTSTKVERMIERLQRDAPKLGKILSTKIPIDGKMSEKRLQLLNWVICNLEQNIFRFSVKECKELIGCLVDSGSKENYFDNDTFEALVKNKLLALSIPLKAVKAKFSTAGDKDFWTYGLIFLCLWCQATYSWTSPQPFYLIDLKKSQFIAIIGSRTNKILKNRLIINQTLAPSAQKQLLHNLQDDNLVLSGKGLVLAHTLPGGSITINDTDEPFTNYQLQLIDVRVNYYGHIQRFSVADNTPIAKFKNIVGKYYKLNPHQLILRKKNYTILTKGTLASNKISHNCLLDAFLPSYYNYYIGGRTKEEKAYFKLLTNEFSYQQQLQMDQIDTFLPNVMTGQLTPLPVLDQPIDVYEEQMDITDCIWYCFMYILKSLKKFSKCYLLCNCYGLLSLLVFIILIFPAIAQSPTPPTSPIQNSYLGNDDGPQLEEEEKQQETAAISSRRQNFPLLLPTHYTNAIYDDNNNVYTANDNHNPFSNMLELEADIPLTTTSNTITTTTTDTSDLLPTQADDTSITSPQTTDTSTTGTTHSSSSTQILRYIDDVWIVSDESQTIELILDQQPLPSTNICNIISHYISSYFIHFSRQRYGYPHCPAEFQRRLDIRHPYFPIPITPIDSDGNPIVITQPNQLTIPTADTDTSTDNLPNSADIDAFDDESSDTDYTDMPPLRAVSSISDTDTDDETDSEMPPLEADPTSNSSPDSDNNNNNPTDDTTTLVPNTSITNSPNDQQPQDNSLTSPQLRNTGSTISQDSSDISTHSSRPTLPPLRQMVNSYISSPLLSNSGIPRNLLYVDTIMDHTISLCFSIIHPSPSDYTIFPPTTATALIRHERHIHQLTTTYEPAPITNDFHYPNFIWSLIMTTTVSDSDWLRYLSYAFPSEGLPLLTVPPYSIIPTTNGQVVTAIAKYRADLAPKLITIINTILGIEILSTTDVYNEIRDYQFKKLAYLFDIPTTSTQWHTFNTVWKHVDTDYCYDDFHVFFIDDYVHNIRYMLRHFYRNSYYPWVIEQSRYDTFTCRYFYQTLMSWIHLLFVDTFPTIHICLTGNKFYVTLLYYRRPLLHALRYYNMDDTPNSDASAAVYNSLIHPADQILLELLVRFTNEPNPLEIDPIIPLLTETEQPLILPTLTNSQPLLYVAPCLPFPFSLSLLFPRDIPQSEYIAEWYNCQDQNNIPLDEKDSFQDLKDRKEALMLYAQLQREWRQQKQQQYNGQIIHWYYTHRCKPDTDRHRRDPSNDPDDQPPRHISFFPTQWPLHYVFIPYINVTPLPKPYKPFNLTEISKQLPSKHTPPTQQPFPSITPIQIDTTAHFPSKINYVIIIFIFIFGWFYIIQTPNLTTLNERKLLSHDDISKTQQIKNNIACISGKTKTIIIGRKKGSGGKRRKYKRITHYDYLVQDIFSVISFIPFSQFFSFCFLLCFINLPHYITYSIQYQQQCEYHRQEYLEQVYLANPPQFIDPSQYSSSPQSYVFSPSYHSHQQHSVCPIVAVNPQLCEQYATSIPGTNPTINSLLHQQHDAVTQIIGPQQNYTNRPYIQQMYYSQNTYDIDHRLDLWQEKYIPNHAWHYQNKAFNYHQQQLQASYHVNKLDISQDTSQQQANQSQQKFNILVQPPKSRHEAKQRQLQATKFIIDQHKKQSHIKSSLLSRLYKALKKRLKLIPTWEHQFGDVTHTQFDIELLPGSTGVRLKNYNYIHQSNVEAEVTRLINNWVEGGAARECSSSELTHISPLLLVNKAKQSQGAKREYRLCLDLQRLNSISINDMHQVPLLIEELHRFKGCHSITKLDLRHGFQHLQISPETQRYCGFFWKGKYYCLTRMGYGFKNAPAIFQRALEETLKDCHHTWSYIDDIYIIEKDDESNLKEVLKVLDRLQRDGWILRLDKCKFFQRSVDHLGRLVDYRGIRQENKHINNIINFPPLKNKKDVMSFLGLINWVGCFNSNILKYKEIISRLRRKNVDFIKNYGIKEKEAVTKIKAIVKSNQSKLLYHPSKHLRYAIDIDASKLGYGAAVYQISKTKIYPIHYISSLWPESLRKWHSTELETVAIVKALDKLSPYFLSKDKCFFVFSDCMAAISNIKKGQTGKNNKFSRWCSFLMSYKFILIHKKGHDMGFTDYLSRLGYNDTTTTNKLSITQQVQMEQLQQQHRIRWMVNNLIPESFQQEIDKSEDPLIHDKYDTEQQQSIIRRWDEINYPSDDESTATAEDIQLINQKFESRHHWNHGHVNPKHLNDTPIIANNPNYNQQFQPFAGFITTTLEYANDKILPTDYPTPITSLFSTTPSPSLYTKYNQIIHRQWNNINNTTANLFICHGNITNFTGQSIVHPTTTTLLSPKGLSGIILRRGGSTLINKIKKHTNSIYGTTTHIPISHARITNNPSHKYTNHLPCDYIIHTVPPRFPSINTPKSTQQQLHQKLYNTYYNILRTAQYYNLKSIALPILSTQKSFRGRTSYKQLLKTALRAIQQHAYPQLDIYLIVYTPSILQQILKYTDNILSTPQYKSDVIEPATYGPIFSSLRKFTTTTPKISPPTKKSFNNLLPTHNKKPKIPPKIIPLKSKPEITPQQTITP